MKSSILRKFWNLRNLNIYKLPSPWNKDFRARILIYANWEIRTCCYCPHSSAKQDKLGFINYFENCELQIDSQSMPRIEHGTSDRRNNTKIVKTGRYYPHKPVLFGVMTKELHRKADVLDHGSKTIQKSSSSEEINLFNVQEICMWAVIVNPTLTYQADVKVIKTDYLLENYP